MKVWICKYIFIKLQSLYSLLCRILIICVTVISVDALSYTHILILLHLVYAFCFVLSCD